MSITIDSRETEIINQFYLSKDSTDIFSIKSLNLGDILISDNVLIERKTWNDLASSIIDGRYKEQSNRLLQAKDEGYTIYYFLEGNLDLYKHTTITKQTLTSCIFSLSYEKKFNVIISKSPKESCEFILQLSKKINKLGTASPNSIPSISSVFHKKKNNQINKENISELMLCQIPCVSTLTARIILNELISIQNIMLELETNLTLFEDFTYLKQDKPKKLNKNVIDMLNHFLRK